MADVKSETTEGGDMSNQWLVNHIQLISGCPYLVAKGVKFEHLNLPGLKVGEKINGIGKGKSSASREVTYDCEITYMGVIWITINGTEIEYAAFRIPTIEVKGWTFFNRPKPVYELYAIIRDGNDKICELMKQNFKTQSIKIYQLIWHKISETCNLQPETR